MVIPFLYPNPYAHSLPIYCFTRHHAYACFCHSLQPSHRPGGTYWNRPPFNDSGVKISTYDGLVNGESIAIRLDFDPADLPVRIDTLEIGLDVSAENSSSWPLLYRLENNINNAPPGTDSLFAQIVRVELTESGWYSIPINPFVVESGNSVIISLTSQDFPGRTPPGVWIDDSTSIETKRNFYR